MKKKRKIFSNNGFTLIELLIVISLLAVLFIPINNVLGLGLKTFNRESENMERMYDENLALEVISEKIRKTSGDLISFNTEHTKLKIKDEEIYLEGSKLIAEKNTVKYTILENVTSFEYVNLFFVTENGVTKLEKFDVDLTVEKKDFSQMNIITTFYLRK